MRFSHLVSSFLATTFLCTSIYGASSTQGALMKKRVLSDLDAIHSIFEVKYAPKEWKGEFAGWDLDRAIEEAKGRLAQNPSPSLKECQVVVRDFFNSTRDYHVGVRFFSTETASLPFLVKGAEGRYFIAHIDRGQLSRWDFPFEEGDEVVSFGGRPVHTVITELRKREFGDNTPETDQALAELSLTHRRGDLGQLVPSGKVEVSCIKKGTTTPTQVTLSWYYSPEKIRDFSKLGLNCEVPLLVDDYYGPQEVRSFLSQSQFLEKFMVSHLWDKSYVGGFTEMNKHALGARSSYIPELGKKTWKSNADSIFDAYIFETPSGKKVGYIRLPHYVGDEEEVEEFGLTMNLFEKRTDALVIDQVNNPGGSVFYLYALAATLADKPFSTPKHHIALTQEEVYTAYQLLPFLEKVTSNESARMVLGDTMGGYPVDYQFVKLMKKFCHFLVNQWECGKLFSDPTYLFGVDQIMPHPQYRYTKPVVLLINSLDFSGGDFFPAILQDNKRATLIGTRTAGAGGYVLSTTYPNHSGIKGFVMTGSMARRADKQPLENLGVTPDIAYELTPDDLQDGYQGYIQAIIDTIEAEI